MTSDDIDEGTSKEEWVGMPEFVLRFETEEDLNDFAKLIGQKLTPKTKSLWFPHKPHIKPYVRRWVDES